MSKRPAGLKRLTSANLARFGADRLAEMLVEMADDDPIWKRRLKMELAAEAGAADLAAEIDKRLIMIAASRARVSWRKRPTLVRDLVSLRAMIVERLGALDARLALDRLIGWVSLYRGLVGRVKDPKGELQLVFEEAGPELAALSAAAHQAGEGAAALALSDAIIARPGDWSRWLHAADAVDRDLAKAVLSLVKAAPNAATAAMRPVLTRLADLAGDVETWTEAFTPAQRRLPEVGAEIAVRLLAAGRVDDARAALAAAQPKGAALARPEPAWERIHIAVLEAQGRRDEAQAARWALFERDLDAAALREILARLADFEDVVALEKAFAHAAAFPRFSAGLEFLIDWPALREAAAMLEARQGEILRAHPRIEEWAARLEARHQDAAEVLRGQRR